MTETAHAAQIAAQYHESLYRWALALSSVNKEEAEEIMQQTYLEVIEGRAKLENADNPRKYLFGIARRVAASRKRRRSIWSRILGKELKHSQVAQVVNPELQAVRLEKTQSIKDAFAQLSRRQAQIATLVFLEDMTIEEAAKILKISVGSARTHYQRAKTHLTKLLEEPNG